MHLGLIRTIVELTAQQWGYMWDHVVCRFQKPTSAAGIELIALHEAWHEIDSIEPPFTDWEFHGGQQISIIKKQLEHRLRHGHIGQPDTGST